MSTRTSCEDAALLLANASDEHGALLGIGYALLDVADAIREQTEALTGDSKGVILIERNQ